MAAEKPAYLFYLILGESIFIEISLISVIAINLRTLWWIKTDLTKRKIQLSPILVFHIGLWIFVALITLINNSYVIIFWHPTKIVYSPAFFYISGITYISLMPSPAVSSFFSTVERCLIFVIHNPAQLKHYQKWLGYANLFAIFAVTGEMLQAFISSAPVPFEETTSNLSPGGMSRGDVGGNRLNATRITISIINLFAATILIYFIHKSKLHNQTQKAVANLVKHVLLVQTFFDLAVHGLAFACSMITASSASNIFGSYARVFTALDGLICCLFFARSVKNLRKKANAAVTISSSMKAAASTLRERTNA